jgi:hypothetical protein
MSGMSGEVDEQPARRSATIVSVQVSISVRALYSQSNIIAMAMKIMSTWWYPMNGTNRLQPVLKRNAMVCVRWRDQ